MSPLLCTLMISYAKFRGVTPFFLFVCFLFCFCYGILVTSSIAP